ncbi:MAG: hypothetical protein L0H31_04625 [Nocardioidaceae bacterium]|nr:hypothetical protein [Nocardioidaceae bacterium]
MRRFALPTLLLTTIGLLLAACGEDADQAKGASSTSAGTSAQAQEGGTSSAGPSATDPSSSQSPSGDAVPAKVTNVADKLDCDLADGTAGFEDETEYLCGPFLIADWSDAGVTEDEMFTNVDKWVDEKRPQWIYTGDKVLVYGTKADLEGVADEFQ